MKLFSIIISICCLFTALAYAVPMAVPKDDSDFDMDEMFLDVLDSNTNIDDMEGIYQFFESALLSSDLAFLSPDSLSKRDERTVSSILLTLNRSGLIFDLLDEIAGHPRRISLLANATARLIESLGGSMDMSSMGEMAAGLNITNVYDIVRDSGLVTSLLDGILLDDNYRPVLVKLITRVVESNKPLLNYIINVVFSKRVSKRADSSSDSDDDNTGTLGVFVTNIVSTVLSSNLFSNILSDVVNALNDTGVAVYVVKRAIADESYQNMTADFVRDLYDTGAINFNSSSINITEIADSVLSDPSAILKVVRALLTGDLNLSDTFGKYAQAIKEIIDDLEDEGLFRDLNDYLFPSNSNRRTSSRLALSATVVVDSSSSGSSSRTTNNRERKQASATSGSEAGSSQASSTSTSSANSGSNLVYQDSNGFIIKSLFFVQSVVFGGALLLV